MRDMLAHAEEHDFTLPEIATLLVGLRLQFPTFEFTTPALYRNTLDVYKG